MRSSFREMICGYALLAVLTPAVVFGATTEDLNKLYLAKQYFDLRDALQNYPGPSSVEVLFYRGAVHNKFNRPDLSIKFLNRFLTAAKNGHTPMRIECYELLADNYRKSYQYRKAADIYQMLLTKFGTLEAKDRTDYENSARLWSALAAVPRQTTTFSDDSFVSHDKDGHFPLEINGHKVALAFDSGANLSVLTSSMAQELGLQIIETAIDVVAIAGNKVKAKLAVARNIKLGNVTIRNSIFLVFEDKDLFVSEANFQIHGLVGFPIIESLKQITFVRGRGVSVPAKPRGGGEQNMALDGLTPLVAGWYKGDRLSFNFDTGANTSILYPPFFKRYEAEIKSAYAEHTERVIGVGGHKEIKGYLAQELEISISGRTAHYEKVPILTEDTNDSSRYFYGNLGQDLVKQFEKTTLNFKAMSIVFE